MKVDLELYDNNYRKNNEFEFNEEKDKDYYFEFIGDKARYIHLIFKENFNGSYFLIQNLEFYTMDEIN